jgi:parallel beta-helix repeat protein
MRCRAVLLTCLQTFLLFSILCTLTSMVRVSYAAVINVPQDHPTIQQAITAASAGDTIQVGRRAGESQSIYAERLVVDKSLTLVGESRDTIIIDGSKGGTVIRVQADYVQIRGFTIQNAGVQYSGIRANGYYYLTIVNNTIQTNKHGIAVLNSNGHTINQNTLFNNSATAISLSESLGNSISENHISESAYAIKLYSTNATFVTANLMEDNSYGVYLEYSSNDTLDGNTLLRNSVTGIFPYASRDLVIKHNGISESAYAIELHTADAITVLDNDATENSYGIYLAYAGPSNVLQNNTLSQNDWGFRLYSASSNTFTGNLLSYNTYGVDPSTGSNGNLFYHNNFVENTEQAVWNPDCVNTWDNGAEGNYWSDYTGSDANGDGIGDTAYTIDPVNRDRRPLMTPWGFFHDIAITNVTVSDSTVYGGQRVNITVTVQNEGTYTETFNVTVRYENTTLAISGTIGTQDLLNLAAEQTIELSFSWDTTPVQPCVNYTVIAEASILQYETDTEDNTYVDGTVKVKLPGDVNGDGIVDILDLTLVSLAYGKLEGEPGYDPEADVNKDGIVDMRDLSTVAMNLGHTC